MPKWSGRRGWRLTDGSGLARTNLVTPETVIKLLRFMYDSPARENWISLLPVGGQDSFQLERAFRRSGIAAASPCQDQDGGTRDALSGYLQRA